MFFEMNIPFNFLAPLLN